jgi:hypothetical protein
LHELDEHGVGLELGAQRSSDEVELGACETTLEVIRRLADPRVEVRVEADLAALEPREIAARDARRRGLSDAKAFAA